jgi:hypothetical protein
MFRGAEKVAPQSVDFAYCTASVSVFLLPTLVTQVT